MVDKLCGIIKRAWYLFAAILSVSLVAGSGFWLLSKGLGNGGSNSDVIGNLIAGLLVFPVAYAIHKAVRWVFFG